MSSISNIYLYYIYVHHVQMGLVLIDALNFILLWETNVMMSQAQTIAESMSQA